MTLTDTAPSRNGTRAIPPLRFVLDEQEITVSVEHITPELAQSYLGRNTHNRNPKKINQAKMVQDMLNGAWMFNGATICFSSEGVLLDGQNRLLAIVTANIPQSLLVVRGLEPRAQETQDVGSARTFGDALKLRGYKDYHALSALTNRVGAWEAGNRRNLPFYKASIAALSGVLAAHPELEGYTVNARRVGRILGCTPSYMGLVWWLFDQVDVDDSAEFFARLEDGQNLNEGNPIYVLRRTFETDQRTRGTNADYIRQVVICIKAWNAYRAGESISILRWRPGGAKPEQFPEPM